MNAIPKKNELTESTLTSLTIALRILEFVWLSKPCCLRYVTVKFSQELNRQGGKLNPSEHLSVLLETKSDWKTACSWMTIQFSIQKKNKFGDFWKLNESTPIILEDASEKNSIKLFMQNGSLNTTTTEYGATLVAIQERLGVKKYY